MLAKNPARLVYGTIVVAALLDAESAVSETYFETVAGVMIAVAMYWLAHAYADFAGHRLTEREAMKPKDFGRAFLREAPILAGAAIPLVALVLCWAAGASLDTAVNVGIYTSAAMLVVIELVSGLRAHLGPIALTVQTLFGAAMGVLVIVLKLVFH